MNYKKLIKIVDGIVDKKSKKNKSAIPNVSAESLTSALEADDVASLADANVTVDGDEFSVIYYYSSVGWNLSELSRSEATELGMGDEWAKMFGTAEVANLDEDLDGEGFSEDRRNLACSAVEDAIVTVAESLGLVYRGDDTGAAPESNVLTFSKP